MKYAYKQNEDNSIVFTSGERIVFWTELMKEEHDKHVADMKSGKIIYMNKEGDLLSRDKDTIWDEATESWIIDEKAIAEKAQNLLITQAQSAFNLANLGRYHFDKLSQSQQKILNDYLSTLNDIILGKVYPLELPSLPDFLR